MLSLLSRIPTVWKLIGAAVIALAIFASYATTYSEGYQNGEDSLRADYERKIAAAKAQARENVVKAERKYQTLIEDIHNETDNEIPAGPITSRVIDSLRGDAGAASE